MPLPQFNHFLSPYCEWKAERAERRLHCCITAAMAQPETDMDLKLYLLMALIGTLLAAVHFTSASEQRSETLPQ